jgi:HEAT repeat protein
VTAEELVPGLEDLQRGPQVQLLLIAMGEAAVEPLARFLLGPPSLHAEPRGLAAEALGAIGGARATRALLDALLVGDLATLPHVLRLSEEAVRNRVARELSRLGDPRAVEPLLEALRRFHLIEAGRALARFGEVRGVPYLIDCLEDSFIRERAAAALLEFGPAAVGPLIESLGRRRAREEQEVRPSLDRRVESARLLGEIKDPRAEPQLVACLTEEAPEVRVAAAVGLYRLAPGARASEVVPALVEGLRSRDPIVADECVEALASIGTAALPAVAEALTLEAKMAEAEGERPPGSALRCMARTLGRMGEPGVAALVSLARHPNPLARGLAVGNLGKAHFALAMPTLLRALRDSDARVRNTAAAFFEDMKEREGLWGTIRRWLGGVLARIGHA